MKILGLYEWIIGTMSDFTRPFRENEQLFQQAKMFWNRLDGWVWIPIFALLGLFFLFWYYKPYNEKPGRHYKPTHWLAFWGISFLVTFLLSELFLFISVSSSLQGVNDLLLELSVGNAVYASVLYLIGSILWCNLGCTNAYKIFRF